MQRIFLTFLFFRAIHNSGGGLMTQNQLEIVMLLHDRGISHTKIAEILEVSTIFPTSFQRRVSLTAVTPT